MQKKVLGIVPSPKGHWVGDGFPVRSLFTDDGLGMPPAVEAVRAAAADV